MKPKKPTQLSTASMEINRRLDKHQQEINALFHKDTRSRTDINELFRQNVVRLQRRDSTTTHFSNQVTFLTDEIQDLKYRAADTADSEVADLSKRVSEIEFIVKDLQSHLFGFVKFMKEAPKLQKQVDRLALRVNEVESVSTKKCRKCQELFQPVKAYHIECKECHLKVRTMPCAICKVNFTQQHHTHKLCENCLEIKSKN